MDTAPLKNIRLVISTPNMKRIVYDRYSEMRAELERYCQVVGLQWMPSKVRDTYLPRGRNVLAAFMLDTDATHHLWLDSDMWAEPKDVLRMLYHVATRPEIEILAAPYPQKFIDWDRVKEAVKRNPNITAKQLECCATGLWTFKGLPDGKHDIGGPIQLTQVDKQEPHAGTGVMIVKRTVYERMKEKLEPYKDSQTAKPVWKFFHCDTDTVKDIWAGEDAWFCHQWHRMGGKIWLAPWVKTEHMGEYSFPGDISEIIDAGMELPV